MEHTETERNQHPVQRAIDHHCLRGCFVDGFTPTVLRQRSGLAGAMGGMGLSCRDHSGGSGAGGDHGVSWLKPHVMS